MSRALVLSGGGSKGAWQVGALGALLESGSSWDAVYGISVGALNAAWLSMFRPEEQADSIVGLYEVWGRVRSSRDVYRPWLPLGLNYFASMWKGSLYSGAPLRKLVGRFWSEERSRSSGVLLSVGCVSLTTGRYRTVTQGSDHIQDYILASAHLPIVFEPLEIEGELWTDGGLRHQVPFLEALRAGHDEIDVVITQPILCCESIPVSLPGVLSAPRVSLRGARILSEQVYYEDCMKVVRAMSMSGRGGKRIRLFAPGSMPNDNSLDFDGSGIQRAMSQGYCETREVLLAGKQG